MPIQLTYCEKCSCLFMSIDDYDGHKCDQKIASNSCFGVACKRVGEAFQPLYLGNVKEKDDMPASGNKQQEDKTIPQAIKRVAINTESKNDFPSISPTNNDSVRLTDRGKNKEFGKGRVTYNELEPVTNHMATVNSADIDKICTCGRKFTLKRLFFKHIKICKHHMEESNHNVEDNFDSLDQSSMSPGLNNGPQIDDSEEEITPFKSKGRKPATPQELKLLSESRTVCDGKILHVCKICDKNLRSDGHFLNHMKIHNNTPDGLWHCEHCDFSSMFKRELKSHTAIHELPYVCDECGLRFSKQNLLNQHVLHHQEGEFPFKCQSCDYICKSKYMLINHNRKHTGDKFKCKVPGCSYETIYHSSLKTHIAIHKDEKPFACQYCEFKTKTKNNLSLHLKIHRNEKNYKCPYCEFLAITKNRVVNHMRIHTKEKHFFCDQCAFKTGTSSSLKIHLMQHLKLKPWQCSVCGYNSITKQKALSHISRKHKEIEQPSDVLIHLGFNISFDVGQYKQPNERHLHGQIKEDNLQIQMVTVEDEIPQTVISVPNDTWMVQDLDGNMIWEKEPTDSSPVIMTTDSSIIVEEVNDETSMTSSTSVEGLAMEVQNCNAGDKSKITCNDNT